MILYILCTHDALYCNLRIGKCQPSFEHNSATLEDVFDWKPESCKVWRSYQVCKRPTTTPKTSRTESEIILYLDNTFFNKEVTMRWFKLKYETNFNNRYLADYFKTQRYNWIMKQRRFNYKVHLHTTFKIISIEKILYSVKWS